MTEVDAHRARIDAAQRRQIVLRRLASRRRDLDAVEHAVVADVRHRAAVRRVDARAEDVLPIVADRDVDDAVLVGIVRLAADHTIHALERAAQALLILRQNACAGNEFQRIGGRRIHEDGNFDRTVRMKIVDAIDELPRLKHRMIHL